MKAVLLTAPQRVEVVGDWPEPALGPHDVLVAMRAVGLCGSDLGVYDGERVTPGLPWVMGHEGGGEIVAVGSAVTDRRLGQRVVVEPNYCCLDCPACRSGRTSACPRRGIVGVNRPGLLAERVAVPARFTWPVPRSWSDARLACLEPLSVARAAVRRAPVRHGDACLVVGAGSQGLFVCQSLLAMGAHPFVVEPHPGRLALAEHLGAKPADLEAGRFPVVFETSGAPAAWETALRAVATTGTVVLIGMGAEPVRLSTFEVVRRQLTLTGALIYDHPHDFGATLAAVADGDIVPERVVHDGFPPEEAATAFAQARTVPGKAWLDLAGWGGQ